MCLGEMATQDDENRVRKLLSAIGKVWTAEEKYFDAVTGLRYPIYRIPTGPTLKDLDACFLTFHCLATPCKDCDPPTLACPGFGELTAAQLQLGNYLCLSLGWHLTNYVPPFGHLTKPKNGTASPL
ncbi:hypothetical protein ZEAMMB73_Zm00001d043756 [Zea mays]|uniref:Uncharacterized protein n=1 Tax=Zea mays TaxID=4577 RepID=A0A1D6NEN1_MAIZE|nr:hypothetical protein ZEAMMB73_Zm00001d043756 [Zea mays]